MIFGNLSTIEITAHADAVVLIPFGACEQHGPHLPLLTDTYIAEGITSMVESSIPENALLAPSIWFGDSVEHDGFAGTLSVGAVPMITMLTDLFTWIAKSGFTKAVLYNAHGGNVHLAAVACEEFSRQSSLKVLSATAYTSAVRSKAKQLFGVSETHGGSTETSLLYALRPDLRKTEETVIKNPHPYKGGGLLSLYPVRELSENGVLEKADQITIDTGKGRELAELMSEELRQTILNFPTI